MNDLMKKLLAKKSQEGKMLSDDECEAKKSVLGQLRGSMNDMMGDKMGQLKKVSVMADSKEGLEEGLSKARELVGKPGELGEPEEELAEHTEPEEDQLSEEEIDAKIAELMALKELKKSEA